MRRDFLFERCTTEAISKAICLRSKQSNNPGNKKLCPLYGLVRQADERQALPLQGTTIFSSNAFSQALSHADAAWHLLEVP